MSHSSRRRQGENNQGVDHISKLPDALLCHILCFVPTKSVVKTSILSKRWKYIWTKVPALDFTEMPDFKWGGNLVAYERFLYKSFVDKVLFHNKASSIQHFRLEVLREYDYFYFDSWISAIMGREVREIDLSSFALPACVLPKRLFVCEALLVLKLEGGLVVDTPASLHLPRLETIHLDCVTFADNDAIEKLSSACPALRELVLEYAFGLSRLTVHSLTLEKLVIKNILKKKFLGDVYVSEEEGNVVVSAPNLKYLRLKGFLRQCNTGNLTALVEANIDVDNDERDVSWVDGFLKSISSVRTLVFVVAGSEQIRCDKLWTFPNLTHLKTRGDGGMYQILNSAPKLVSLVVIDDLCSGRLCPPKTASKRLPSITLIEIQDFQGHEDQMEMVTYFLSAALLLKKMKIHMHTGIVQRERNAFKDLLMLPRASNACQVEMCSRC